MTKSSISRSFKRWLASAGNAVNGILFAAKSQRHIKFHLCSAFMVLLFCFFIGLEKLEFVAVTIIVLLVITAEMLNTSIETVVDLSCPDRNELAKTAKDISAGAVLVVSVGALIVGYLILWPYIMKIFTDGFRIVKHAWENIAILAVTMTILTTILFKAYLGRRYHYRAEFMGGRAAIMASIGVSIWQGTINGPARIFFVPLFIVVVFAGRRLNLRRLLGVLTGAFSGFLLTYLLFNIFF